MKRGGTDGKTVDHRLVVAVVGLCGAGKSEGSDWFVAQGFVALRFGQLTLDEVRRRGLLPTESNERRIREGLRRKFGPAAFAKLNLPKIYQILRTGRPVLVDGLYSWAEYKFLRQRLKDNFFVVAVYAPPATRYARLENRSARHPHDPLIRYRSFSKREAAARDEAEIEKIEKAGPIAMADYTVRNTGSIRAFHRELGRVRREILTMHGGSTN